METRKQENFKVEHANTGTKRMKKSAIIHMQHLLNHENKQKQNIETHIKVT